MRGLIARVPAESKFIIMLDHDEWGMPDGIPKAAPWVTRFNGWMRELAADYCYVGVACFTDLLAGPHELQVGGNHSHREVYLRMANRIARTSGKATGQTRLGSGFSMKICRDTWATPRQIYHAIEYSVHCDEG